MYRCLALGSIGDHFLNFLQGVLVICRYDAERKGTVRKSESPYKVVKDTFVELPFCRSALPQLLVIVVQAGPVLAELGQAVLVDIFNSARWLLG